MSMHDMEWSAQELVWLIGNSQVSNEEKISLIYNIYKFHDQWDVGFTRFRVYDILVDTGFFHFFEIEEHPDYGKYREFFDGLRETDFEYIYDDPVKGYAEGLEPNSYWFGEVYDNKLEKEVPLGKMACEPGMTTWKHFKGNDGYEKMGVYEMLSRVAEIASESENGPSFLAEVYHMMLYALWEEPVEDEMPFAEKLKELVLTEDVMEEYHYGDSVFYAKPDLLDEEYLETLDDGVHKEWMRFYFDWLAEWDEIDVSDGDEDEDADDSVAFLAGWIEKYKDMIKKGDMESVYREYSALMETPDIEELLRKSYLEPGIRMFEVMPESEYHEETMTRDLAGIEDPAYRRFVEQYRTWYPRRDDLSYYEETAREFIDTGMIYDGYITAERGLLKFPDDPYLKLYRASSIILLGADDEYIEEEMRILDGLAKEMPDHQAVIHYLRGVALFDLGQREKAEPEFLKAVEIDPRYEEQYGHFKKHMDESEEEDEK